MVYFQSHIHVHLQLSQKKVYFCEQFNHIRLIATVIYCEYNKCTGIYTCTQDTCIHIHRIMCVHKYGKNDVKLCFVKDACDMLLVNT